MTNSDGSAAASVSTLIDPATGQPFGAVSRSLVPKVEDFPPVSDTDVAELRAMLEGAFSQGCAPTDCIPASLQSLAMMLRVLERNMGSDGTEE